MNKNFLANLFTWFREVIEAAESPFSKLAIFVLPIITPLVPAVITGIRLHDLLELDNWICWIAGVVLELLGYVGALAFIKSIYDYVHDKTTEHALPIVINGLAYGFYLLGMYLINVKLGELANDPPVVKSVFALLSFLTVPTGLLAAQHIRNRDKDEKDTIIRHEEQDYSLRKTAIKQGINIFAAVTGGSTSAEKPKEKKIKHASDYHDKAIAELEKKYLNGYVLTLAELIAELKIPYNKSKGYMSGLRREWMKSKGIQDK